MVFPREAAGVAVICSASQLIQSRDLFFPFRLGVFPLYPLCLGSRIVPRQISSSCAGYCPAPGDSAIHPGSSFFFRRRGKEKMGGRQGDKTLFRKHGSVWSASGPARNRARLDLLPPISYSSLPTQEQILPTKISPSCFPFSPPTSEKLRGGPGACGPGERMRVEGDGG